VADPRQRARRLAEKEETEGNLHDAGERGGEGIQAGKELGDGEKAELMATNISSTRRTQESGSSVMRHRSPSTVAPRRRPKVYQRRSATRQPATAAPMASPRLSRPAPRGRR